MNIILIPLLGVLGALVSLYSWAVIIYTLLLWLVALNIVNSFNRLVFSALNFLANIIDPVLMRIRVIVPTISGIDLSPLVLILILTFIKGVIAMTMEALY